MIEYTVCWRTTPTWNSDKQQPSIITSVPVRCNYTKGNYDGAEASADIDGGAPSARRAKPHVAQFDCRLAGVTSWQDDPAGRCRRSRARDADTHHLLPELSERNCQRPDSRPSVTYKYARSSGDVDGIGNVCFGWLDSIYTAISAVMAGAYGRYRAVVVASQCPVTSAVILLPPAAVPDGAAVYDKRCACC